MENHTVNNAITLLKKCITNGKSGKDTLYAWFLGEQLLIERMVTELDIYIQTEQTKECSLMNGCPLDPNICQGKRCPKYTSIP